MKHIKTFENFLNEYGPLAGSGNVDQLEKIKRDAMKKSERGDTVYVVGGKNGTFKISKYYEEDNTYAAFHNGMAIPVDESLVNEAYKRIPYNVKIAGEYTITINSRITTNKVAGFERQNDDSDLLYLMDNDPLKDEHGGFIVKNSDMAKLSKGTSVKAMCSKHNVPATLKRIGDL